VAQKVGKKRERERITPPKEVKKETSMLVGEVAGDTRRGR